MRYNSKMKAFQIKVNGKILDYRLGAELDLDEIKAFFAKKYQVVKLWSAGRHVVGTLRKDNRELWLKLATTCGIGALTQNEFAWNEQFNLKVSRSSSNYWVPENYASGFYHDLFYLITDRFDGQLLTEKPEKNSIASKVILENLSAIIGFAETIQGLKMSSRLRRDPDLYEKPGSPIRSGMTNKTLYHQKHFLEKTVLWYQDIPQSIKEKYQVAKLLKMVEESSEKLLSRPRHGDFTPWHLMLLENGKLGLIDGEHALNNGVENYDLGYFLQRVYSVLEDPVLARKILILLIKKGYKVEKLKPILGARAIGGFLDEALKPKPNYQIAVSFQEFVKSL